jgi:DNA gyrase subunit A
MAEQVRKAGRQTKGVRLMNLGEGTTLLAIARNADEPSDVASAGTEEAGIDGDDTESDNTAVPEN